VNSTTPLEGYLNHSKKMSLTLMAGFLWSISNDFKAAISYQQVVDYNVSWPYANYFTEDSLSALLVFDFFNKVKVDAFSLSLVYRFSDFAIGVTPVAYST
jgi:long-subunit fatty acid transport protein